jgi:hypothetical protein
MTIDEAIRHCEEVAWESDKKAMCIEEAYQTTEQQNCEQCAADHRQLAEWLKELKELREEKEIALSVRTGAKAKYNYTDEQVTAYWQGVEDCAKDTIDKRQKCDLDILRGINGVAVGINNYRVTDGKIYGMLVTEGHFKLNCYDVIHAICKEHSAAEALKLIGGETDEHL